MTPIFRRLLGAPKAAGAASESAQGQLTTSTASMISKARCGSMRHQTKPTIATVATGRKVAARAGERLVPCVTELGGKSPFVVLASADLERAAEAAAWSSFLAVARNSAWACSRYATRTIGAEEVIFLRNTPVYIRPRTGRIGQGGRHGMGLAIPECLLYRTTRARLVEADDWRSAQVARLGLNTWKALYSLVAIAGFVLLYAVFSKLFPLVSIWEVSEEAPAKEAVPQPAGEEVGQ